MATAAEATSFKCRKCRYLLFNSDDLLQNHVQTEQCSSWYLKDEDMLSWVQRLVDESGWTEGKLYCPKCNGRVGGFDFVHVVQCSCMMDVIPAIWCPKSRVDAASHFVHRSLEKQPLDAEIGINFSNRGGTTGILLNGGSSREDFGCSNDKFSFEVSAECETEMQNNSVHFLQNSIVNCNERTCDSKQNVFSLINSCNKDSQGNSHFTDSRLPRNFKTDKLKVINKVPSSLCPSSQKHFSSSKSDSPVCYSSYVCLKNTAKSTSADACSSVRHIKEELKEIKREVQNLHSSHCCDGSFQDVSMETVGRRRRRPRRRGRGNWQYGADYKALMEEVKESNYQHGCHNGKKLPISLHRPYRVEDGNEKGKESSDSEIPDCYKCSVCLCLLYQPFKTPCDHVFCALCMKQLNHVSRGRPKCPLCRQPVTSVEAEEDLEAEIQVAFPVNYRKRAKETRKNRHRRSALPSPQSTTFDSPVADEQYETNFRLIHQIAVIALAISLLINSLFVNHHGNAIARANLQRNIALFIFIVVGCMFASLFLLCLVLFAFDFVKIALLLVLSYVAVIKLAVGLVLN